jgi:hypothetical protein
MNAEFTAYNQDRSERDRPICDELLTIIDSHMSGDGVTSKIWHGSPVWFIDGNPIVGYHSLKSCVRVLFWSGQSFSEPGLHPEGTFKAAEKRYTSVDEIDSEQLLRWLADARQIQWDYKNIRRRKGDLVPIGNW